MCVSFILHVFSSQESLVHWLKNFQLKVVAAAAAISSPIQLKIDQLPMDEHLANNVTDYFWDF